MYEPIIDPMIFYWIDLADQLPSLVILSGILTAGLALFTADSYEAHRESDDQPQEYKTFKKATKIATVFFCVFGLLSFFTPSKDTMYKMLIAKQVTPHNLQVTGETVDKALDKVVEKIIKITQEVKK